tara:strand:- start:236 stop:556 length:321 start_codon:yes stop_codon:yes gene_type:complete
MEEKSIFLAHVGGSPRMRLLQFLIEGRDFDYTLTDMLNANISWGTLNALVPKLAKLNIIIPVRKIGRATLYKINIENKTAHQLIKLYDDLLSEQIDKQKTHVEVIS